MSVKRNCVAVDVTVDDVSSGQREGRCHERTFLLDVAAEVGAVLAVELAEVDVRDLQCAMCASVKNNRNCRTREGEGERTTSNQRTLSLCSERGTLAEAGGAMTFLPDTRAGEERMKVTQQTTMRAMPARIQPRLFQTASSRFTVVRLSAMLGCNTPWTHRRGKTPSFVLRDCDQRNALWCTRTRD